MSEDYVIVKKVFSRFLLDDGKYTLYWTGGRRRWVLKPEKAHIYRSRELVESALKRLRDPDAKAKPFSGA